MAIEVIQIPMSCSNGPPAKEVPEALKPKYWRSSAWIVRSIASGSRFSAAVFGLSVSA